MAKIIDYPLHMGHTKCRKHGIYRALIAQTLTPVYNIDFENELNDGRMLCQKTIKTLFACYSHVFGGIDIATYI